MLTTDRICICIKYVLIQMKEMEMFSEEAEGTGADLVREALGLQLLFFESLLQSENLGLVFLHCQLDYLARLGDPLIGSCPAGETRAWLSEVPP